MNIDFSVMFNEFISDHQYFLLANEIARSNADGDLWIIGGFVYRNLTALLHGGTAFHSDIDFVANEPVRKDFTLPDGWVKEVNSYGVPKFRSGDDSIDLSSFIGWHSIESRGLEPTVESALSRSPLNVQSIAFDLQKRKIIGDIGIQAILSKTVRVHDRERVEAYAGHKKKPVEQIIREKADSLGFTPIFN